MIEATLEITLDDFAPLFGYEFGDCFLLITSPDIRSSLKVSSGSLDCDISEFSWFGKKSRQNLILEFFKFHQNNLRCSALWITTDEYEHFQPLELGNIKIAAISLFSSPFSIITLQRILDITKKTDYQLQVSTESKMLDLLDSAKQILFQCLEHNTQAYFRHHESNHWFSLHGPLGFGQQTVLPTGELSVLPESSGQFNRKSYFSLNGQLLFQGFPIVHRSHSEIPLSETLEQFKKLASMRDFPVIASISNGEISHLHSPVEGYNPFLVELEKLFLKDDNYRKIHEIGFGTNRDCAQLVYENFLPNERYPGAHFGLGLGGATNFHIDLVCSKIEVLVKLEHNENLQNLYS